MPNRDSDRNLLFGILALQMDFITRDALVAAMNAWVLEKHRALGEILVERGALDPVDWALLDPMVDRHVAKHGGDPLASLAALSSIDSTAESLRQSIADPDVLASITQASGVAETTDYVPVAGRFRKVRDHARGGLGVVFVARDEELHREVALKEIQDRHADDLDKRARFLMEAEITGGLEHPGIVPVYALGHYEDGRPFYAMRFIKGDSLKEAISRFHADQTLKHESGQRALALQKLLRRFLDVCNAVAYAHSRGILHRDLKPENVMVGRYGETLVVDWGLAKVVGRSGEDRSSAFLESTLLYTSPSGSAETLPGSVIGTPAYMSPEQAVGRLDLLGPRSDVYSLGATLYSLLTGVAPFTGGEIADVLRKVEQSEFARPRDASPWLDPALEAIALKAMALRPDDRYASPQALADDLERWLADEPVLAYPEPFTRRARRWARRHRTALATVGSAAAVAIGLLGAVVWLRIDQRNRTDASAQRTMQQAEILAVEARTSGDLARWEKAIAETVRARERVESGGGSLALHNEVENRLEGFRVEQSRRREVLDAEAKDREMIAELDEARLRATNVKEGHFDDEAKLDAYRTAFRAYGIDVEALPVEDGAKRIRASKIVDELISALDDWSRYQMTKVPRERLQALASAAETDPVRATIREAIAKGDAASLRHLIERPEDRDKLGARLRIVFQARLGLDSAANFLLLETVRGERPSDFWINHDLGMAYKDAKPPRAQDAERCLSVAVALRPNSPGAQVNLGAALRAQGKLGLAAQAYRKAIQLKPNYADAHYNLGVILSDQGELDLAAQSFRKAIEIQPDYAGAYYNLGDAQQIQGKLDLAAQSFRKAIELKPDYAWAYNSLGTVLAAQRKLDLAIESFRKAIELQPDHARAHNNLGTALKAKGEPVLAVESFRKAIELDPDYADAHNGLGSALYEQGKLDLAAQSFHKAIEIRPDYAEAHTGLGLILYVQGKHDQAVECWLKAIQIKPNYADAHNFLGNARLLQGNHDQAVESYRKAIEIKPDYARAHTGLALTLQAQGKLDQAVKSFHKAIELEPAHAANYFHLGLALAAQENIDQAVEAYRKAIEVSPDYAEATCNLGLLLGRMGRFQEALEFLERGHALGSRRPGWPNPSQTWVQLHRRLLELDTKLPAILKGEAKPTDAAERLDLAVVCYRKGLHAASARFAGEAFAETPALANNPQTRSRYNAARSAILAGWGQGKDEPMPDEAARAKFREQALVWLRADLAAWAEVLDGGNEPARKQALLRTLAHWKGDAALAGTRDAEALAKLPEAEREAWKTFWADVEALLKLAQGPKP
jgi:eukaryotic-like serine/threonine-protein kinase